MLDFRALTPEELVYVEGTSPHRSTALSAEASSQTIVVTGYRLININLGQFFGGGNDSSSGSSEVPPPLECHYTDASGTMTEAQALDAKIDMEADKIRAEILAQANQNMEYGSIIYVDSAGQIRHTPLLPSADWHANLAYAALPTNANGQTDYSTVLAVVHSHPQFLEYDANPGPDNFFDPDRPDRLLVPSVRDNAAGDFDDWQNFDDFVGLITSAGGDAAHFSTYIAGFNGSTLALNQYFANDRNTPTSASGDFVPIGYDPGIHCDYFRTGAAGAV